MDKNARMSTSSSLIENGFVYFPSQADWLESYRHELLVFPGGQYDDQADSTSQAWEWIKRDMLEPWIIALGREEEKSADGSSTTADQPVTANEDPEPSTSAKVQSRECGKCGNPNLSWCRVQGISGDIEETCPCGWSRRIPSQDRVRTPEKVKAPSFE